MRYGVDRRSGFIQITGEIGAGKTTLSRMFLQQLGENVHTSLVFNPKLSELELLQGIVEDFGLKPKAKKRKEYFDCLNRFLLEESAKGFNAVVIIDEAQHLQPQVNHEHYAEETLPDYYQRCRFWASKRGTFGRESA